MKKLLFLLAFLPIFAWGQCVQPDDVDINMSVTNTYATIILDVDADVNVAKYQFSVQIDDLPEWRFNSNTNRFPEPVGSVFYLVYGCNQFISVKARYKYDTPCVVTGSIFSEWTDIETKTFQ